LEATIGTVSRARMSTTPLVIVTLIILAPNGFLTLDG
jgi:hypothetical protein